MSRRMNNFNHRRSAFTLVEALTALIIVGFICSTVLIVITNCIDSISNQENRLRAIDLARENMESLLGQDSIEEFSETGISEIYPDIEWTRGVELVAFSGSSKLWMKATSSANFYNTDNEFEEIEFENWLAPLTDQQEKLVMKDRQNEEDYLLELEQDELDALEEEEMLEEQADSDINRNTPDGTLNRDNPSINGKTGDGPDAIGGSAR